MPLDFSALKKQSSLNVIEKLGKKETYGNENFWKPTFDPKGNSNAIIRFLPSPPGEEDSVVSIYQHSFEVNGKWFIENCPTTLGKGSPCPVCENNTQLWNQGESGQTVVRKRKRKLSYIANVLIVQDKKNPEAEGTVKLYKFGQKVFEKIKAAATPPVAEDAIDVFSLWEGANFVLISENIGGYVNYDKSYFRKPEPVSKDDEKLEEIWRSEFSLQEQLTFLTYEELKQKFNYVTGKSTPAAEALDEEELDEEEFVSTASELTNEELDLPF